jgi:hypothetical protein
MDSEMSLVPDASPVTVTVATVTAPLSSVSASAARTSTEELSAAKLISVVASAGSPLRSTPVSEATVASEASTVKS